MNANFNCGHPRTQKNSTFGYLHRNGTRYSTCSLCRRVRYIVAGVDRQLERWKTGKLTRSEIMLRRVV